MKTTGQIYIQNSRRRNIAGKIRGTKKFPVYDMGNGQIENKIITLEQSVILFYKFTTFMPSVRYNVFVYDRKDELPKLILRNVQFDWADGNMLWFSTKVPSQTSTFD